MLYSGFEMSFNNEFKKYFSTFSLLHILLFHHKDKKKYDTAQGFFKQIYCNYVHNSAIAVQTQYKSRMVERGWPPILADQLTLGAVRKSRKHIFDYF